MIMIMIIIIITIIIIIIIFHCAPRMRKSSRETQSGSK